MDEPSRIDSVAEEVALKLSRGFLSPRTLLSRMSVIDQPSRTVTIYEDSNYLPFYFHLGRATNPRDIFCFGAEIGLQVGCLLKGCGDPRSAFCFQPPGRGPYSPRVAISNVKSATRKNFPISIHVGVAGEDAIPQAKRGCFDLSMIVVPLPVDSLMDSMDLCWSLLREEGTLVVDMLDEGKAGAIFFDFCRARGLRHRVLKTRYGTGIAGR